MLHWLFFYIMCQRREVLKCRIVSFVFSHMCRDSHITVRRLAARPDSPCRQLGSVPCPRETLVPTSTLRSCPWFFLAVPRITLLSMTFGFSVFPELYPSIPVFLVSLWSFTSFFVDTFYSIVCRRV